MSNVPTDRVEPGREKAAGKGASTLTRRIRLDVPLGTSYTEIQESIFRQGWNLAGSKLHAAIAFGIAPETLSLFLNRCDRERAGRRQVSGVRPTSTSPQPARICLDVPFGTPYLHIQESILRQAWELARTQLRAAIALGITPDTVSRILRHCDRLKIGSPPRAEVKPVITPPEPSTQPGGSPAEPDTTGQRNTAPSGCLPLIEAANSIGSRTFAIPISSPESGKTGPSPARAAGKEQATEA